MTPDYLPGILDGAMAVCAVMAVFNGLRFRSRGAAALLLSAAFISLALTIWFFKKNSSAGALLIAAIVTIALLIAEFSIRSMVAHPKEDGE